MRIIVLRALCICSFLALNFFANSATTPTADNNSIRPFSDPVPLKNFAPSPSLYKHIASLKVKDLRKFLGRKLTIKERVSFFLLKNKIKNPADKSSKGKTALIFGIVGLGLFVLSFFLSWLMLGALISSIVAVVVGSVARKENPNDKQALAGRLLGFITLGLIVLLLVLAVAIIATWNW